MLRCGWQRRRKGLLPLMFPSSLAAVEAIAEQICGCLAGEHTRVLPYISASKTRKKALPSGDGMPLPLKAELPVSFPIYCSTNILILSS